MAKNLLKAGYQLVVYDLNSAVVEEVVAAGAAPGKSPLDVAAPGGDGHHHAAEFTPC